MSAPSWFGAGSAGERRYSALPRPLGPGAKPLIFTARVVPDQTDAAVIARSAATKQSRGDSPAALDCFAALAMTAAIHIDRKPL